MDGASRSAGEPIACSFIYILRNLNTGSHYGSPPRQRVSYRCSVQDEPRSPCGKFGVETGKMTSRNKGKKGAWLTAGVIAIAAAGLSAPAMAKPSDDRGGESRGEGQRVDRGTAFRAARPDAAMPLRQQDRPQVQRPQQVAPQQAVPQARTSEQRGWQGRAAQRGDGDGRPAWRGQPQAQQPVARPVGDARQEGWRNGGQNWRDRNDDARRGNDNRGDNWRRDNDNRNDNWRRDNDNRNDNWRRDNDNRNDSWRRGNDNRNDRWRNDRNDRRDWDRGAWRRDNRYDWQRYRDRNRNVYRIGRYYAPYSNYSYRRIGIGFSLGSLFYGNRYWIDDPWQYRLPAVYGPYRWVRYYDDVLLVDTYSGQVVDVIYDFFW